MNAMTRPVVRRLRSLAMLAAAGLALNAGTAWARSPVEAELDECVARAERYFATDAIEVYKAEVFRQNSGREVLALDLQLTGGVKPRFYCRLDIDGRVAQVQTLPRLPAREDTMVVAK
jgi:hypothetical protein